jgi:hypothetical protein
VNKVDSDAKDIVARAAASSVSALVSWWATPHSPALAPWLSTRGLYEVIDAVNNSLPPSDLRVLQELKGTLPAAPGFSGDGGGFTPTFEPTMVVGYCVAAGATALLVRAGRLSETELIAASLDAFHATLNANRGKPVTQLSLVGFDGVTWDPDVTIALPWGEIRCVPNEFSKLAYGYPTTALFTRAVTLSAHDTKGTPASATAGVTWADLMPPAGHVINMIRLAFALGRKKGPWPSVRARWSTQLLPFLPISGVGGTEEDVHPKRVALTRDEVREVEAWARAIEENQCPALDIPMRRILSAVPEYGYWDDRLVDAVIAWEGLLGATTETTFRLCAALAVLLEPDDTGRRHLVFAELKGIYDARSKVVHGKPYPPKRNSSLDTERSIAVGLEALRRLLRDRKDLLTIPASDKRGEALLLGK